MSTRKPHVSSKVCVVYTAHDSFEPECGHFFSVEAAYEACAHQMVFDKYWGEGKRPDPYEADEYLELYVKREKRLAKFLAFVDKCNGIVHDDH